MFGDEFDIDYEKLHAKYKKKSVGLLGHIRRFFRSRMFIVALFILVEITFITLIATVFYGQAKNLLIGVYALSLVVLVWMAAKPGHHPNYKLAWAMVIMFLPPFGALVYLMTGYLPSKTAWRFTKKLLPYTHDSEGIPENEDVVKELEKIDMDAALQARYVKNTTGYTIFDSTSVQYFGSGQEFLPVFLEDLKAAEKFIFLEFFIVERGIMFDSILNIMKEKAANGVDCRIMYDDIGSAVRVEPGFRHEIESYGIRCVKFNPHGMKPSYFLNNRDHRKIAVIDGDVAYTGGLNLADEYINAIHPLGYWKDSMVRLEGEAPNAFTVMFLQYFDFADRVNPENPFDFIRNVGQEGSTAEKFNNFLLQGKINQTSDGFIMPYSSATPATGIPVGRDIYINIINDAREYIYITTPYLILENEMINALRMAALSGVDVRIMTPGIPDKKMVYEITRANYDELIRAGVKIYEYTPGFVHAKMIVADDAYAVVGTCNFDYRSFYLHHECGVWTYGSSLSGKVRDDILSSLDLCHEITRQDVEGIGIVRRAFRTILMSVSSLF